MSENTNDQVGEVIPKPDPHAPKVQQETSTADEKSLAELVGILSKRVSEQDEKITSLEAAVVATVSGVSCCAITDSNRNNHLSAALDMVNNDAEAVN